MAEKKEETEIKDKAISVMSILQTMTDLEDFNGVTEQSIYQNWYELKRQLRDAFLAEQKEEKK